MLWIIWDVIIFAYQLRRVDASLIWVRYSLRSINPRLRCRLPSFRGLLIWGGFSPELAHASTHLRGAIIQKCRYLHGGNNVLLCPNPDNRQLHGLPIIQPTTVPV